MQPFTTLTSRVIPLLRDHVDTDQIIPGRYLKVVDKSGLAEGLFANWRYTADGTPDPDFVLNQPRYQDARILLAGVNFGCGSSREHAPWALLGWGIRAVIAPSFADIFRSNALKNGLLPVQLDEAAYRALVHAVQQQPTVEVTIDLAARTLRLPDGRTASFPLEPFAQRCLVQGLDWLGYLLAHEADIAAYERRWGK